MAEAGTFQKGWTVRRNHIILTFKILLYGFQVRIYRPVSWVILGLLDWGYEIFLLLLGVWRG